MAFVAIEPARPAVAGCARRAALSARPASTRAAHVLYRARRLEQAPNTPARIYYKYEGVSPAGNHKPNTAVAQGYYKKQEGTKRLTTETGAARWGGVRFLAYSMFDLGCMVYMVKAR